MEFQETRLNPHLIDDHLHLLQTCFPHSSIFSKAYLTWLYLDNPAGEVVGYDAFHEGQLAATYVCIPTRAVLRGRPVRALLSLNTATAPNHRGKGLFTKLAERCYAHAENTGYEVVFGVANASSIGGFSRKLGFQDVISLEARVGIGPFPRIDFDQAYSQAEFRCDWDLERLTWRAGNPAGKLSLSRQSERIQICGATDFRLVNVQGELPLSSTVASTASLRPAPFRLHLGLAPRGTSRGGLSIAIPDKMKPSPLRLIYRNLSASDDRINSDSVFFQFIDFDAY
ncbi:GNAT family N-acetyltransferase [Pseudohoeflea coraliihabitans]|uniref:GNAT family N-acetyltransferase n=1 Tax=Pseudohoeflea coraliihabitans TaxID=2860393 RepID=A0ABS6WLV5_9HYPH|nr:GNAT family N-acetyltransferase [Pseudohoeflea sp. DP4N28-3]MBW3096880.1 GNAT family N-acetyltransferase [Pseudohoeflea sp. DP4N28-3]